MFANAFIYKNRYLIYISIQILCYETQNWAQVHPVSIDHPWDVSTSWLESTCYKFNWLDMIWKGTSLYIRSHSWQHMSEQKPSNEVEGNVGKGTKTDLGKGTKTFLQDWRSPRTQWPPSFLNGRRLEPPRLFLELPLGQTEKSGDQTGQGGDQESDGHSDRAPEFLCGNGRTFQKDNHLCSTPPIRPLW